MRIQFDNWKSDFSPSKRFGRGDYFFYFNLCDIHMYLNQTQKTPIWKEMIAYAIILFMLAFNKFRMGNIKCSMIQMLIFSLRLNRWFYHWNHLYIQSNSIKQTQFRSNNIFYLFYHTHKQRQELSLSIEYLVYILYNLLQSNADYEIPLNLTLCNAIIEKYVYKFGYSYLKILKMYFM